MADDNLEPEVPTIKVDEPTIALTELIAALDNCRSAVGDLPLCPSWMYTAIRHCQRNLDFDVREGFHEPDRQCGGEIAKIINLIPDLIAALAETNGGSHE